MARAGWTSDFSLLSVSCFSPPPFPLLALPILSPNLAPKKTICQKVLDGEETDSLPGCQYGLGDGAPPGCLDDLRLASVHVELGVEQGQVFLIGLDVQELVCFVVVVHQFVAKGDQEVNDDAVRPSEPCLNLVFTAATGGAGIVDIVLRKKDFGTRFWLLRKILKKMNADFVFVSRHLRQSCVTVRKLFCFDRLSKKYVEFGKLIFLKRKLLHLEFVHPLKFAS